MLGKGKRARHRLSFLLCEMWTKIPQDKNTYICKHAINVHNENIMNILYNNNIIR